MSEAIDKEILTVVKQLHSCIRKVGVKRVLGALSSLMVTPDKEVKEDNLVKVIIDSVTKEYECSYSDLKKPDVRGNLNNARKTCFLLIKENTTLNHDEIAELFCKRNHALVSHAITFKSKLDPDIKQDREFLDKFYKVEKIVQFHLQKSK